MRILFYSGSSTIFGAPSSLVNLIDGLRQIEPTIELHVVLPSKGKLEQWLKARSVDYQIIPHYKWSYNYAIYQRKKKENSFLSELWLIKNIALRFLKNVFYLRRHVALAKKYKPDFLYVNSSLAPMGAVIACMLRVKLIWHHRETVNDIETGFFLDYGRRLSAILFRKADIHIHPSNFLFGEYSFLNKNQSSYVVFNGVFSRKFKPSIRKRRTNTLTIGVIGRINRQKGQEDLLRAFLKINFGDLLLKFYGDGEPSYIEHLKSTYPSKNVFFEKFVEREVIFEDVDFIVVNARNESFGRVVTEAFAYSKPVIGLTSGAIPELIKDRHNGFLYFTESELIRALVHMRSLFFSENGMFCELGRNARNDFEDYFTLEQYSEAIYRILQKTYTGKIL